MTVKIPKKYGFHSVCSVKEEERNLQIELAVGIKKDQAKGEWQVALDSFQGMKPGELLERLQFLHNHNPQAFCRFLSLIFEPNSLKVSTHRKERAIWYGKVDDYTLTPSVVDLRKQMASFVQSPTDR